MKLLRDSTDLQGDPAALRQRFGDDGYVFLRGVADREALEQLRQQVLEVLRGRGWLDRASPPYEAVPKTLAHFEGEAEYVEALKEIQRLEAFHALPHSHGVLRCMQALLGETAFPHPLGIVRLIFPNNNETSTPPHQDYPNNQGTEDLYTCWIPLSDCPREHGSVAVLEGSHRVGLLPLEFALGPGLRQAVLDERVRGLEWAAADFAQGDVLIFHSLTVHRALDNHTRSMRLSVDYRYQREGEALTLSCLRPHFQAQEWATIYEGWKDRSLQYYWEKKSYTVVEWNSELHKVVLPDDEAGRIWHEYDRVRRERAPKP